MIKSDEMKRICLPLLALALVLSGCGQRRLPDVEHFQGDVIATLQKPVSQTVPAPLENTPLPVEESEPTPEPSKAEPGPSQTATPVPTQPASQDDPYPAETELDNVTPSPTATSSGSLTPTMTLGAPVWDGVWNIWYQNPSGGYVTAAMTVRVNGAKVSGSATLDGILFSFQGESDQETGQVKGEWKTDNNKGTFWWRMNAADSFVGSRDDRFGMCASRSSTVQPNPCREIPQT